MKQFTNWIEVHEMNHTVLKCVTSHTKTYTNGFVLYGQKPRANQRVANGFSNGFNGFLNAFNGCTKTFKGL